MQGKHPHSAKKDQGPSVDLQERYNTEVQENSEGIKYCLDKAGAAVWKEDSTYIANFIKLAAKSLLAIEDIYEVKGVQVLCKPPQVLKFQAPEVCYRIRIDTMEVH